MRKKYVSIILILASVCLMSCGKSEENERRTDDYEQSSLVESAGNELESDKQQEGTNITDNSDDETTTVVKDEDETSKEENSTDEATSVEETSTEETTVQVQTTTQETTTKREVATTTKETTTTKPEVTQPATEATTSKYIVDYGQETVASQAKEYKYGLKITTTTYNYYALYSDGSKELYDSWTSNSYDYSGYSATDEELLSESNAKTTEHMEYYKEVLRLVNEIRAEAGVQALMLDTTLCQAATMRAVEMNYSDLFSHTRPDGTSCFTVFGIYNITYNTCGENIAAGYSSPEEVVEGWKNSSGHYANMINANFNKLGVGMSDEEPGSYGKYWVQLFTN